MQVCERTIACNFCSLTRVCRHTPTPATSRPGIYLQVEYGRAVQPEALASTLQLGSGSQSAEQLRSGAQAVRQRLSAFGDAFEFSLGEVQREGRARQRLEERAQQHEDLRVCLALHAHAAAVSPSGGDSLRRCRPDVPPLSLLAWMLARCRCP